MGARQDRGKAGWGQGRMGARQDGGSRVSSKSQSVKSVRHVISLPRGLISRPLQGSCKMHGEKLTICTRGEAILQGKVPCLKFPQQKIFLCMGHPYMGYPYIVVPYMEHPYMVDPHMGDPYIHG